MDARTRDAGLGSPDRFLHCRVVWDDAEEVGVWVANGDKPELVWRERVEVIEAVADRALEQVRDEARGADLALDAVEVLRDPQRRSPGAGTPLAPAPQAPKGVKGPLLLKQQQQSSAIKIICRTGRGTRVPD